MTSQANKILIKSKLFAFLVIGLSDFMGSNTNIKGFSILGHAYFYYYC